MGLVAAAGGLPNGKGRIVSPNSKRSPCGAEHKSKCISLVLASVPMIRIQILSLALSPVHPVEMSEPSSDETHKLSHSEEFGPPISIPNHGPGPQNVAAGSSSQHNNNAGGTQFNNNKFYSISKSSLNCLRDWNCGLTIAQILGKILDIMRPSDFKNKEKVDK